jgi:hypothetical protein
VLLNNNIFEPDFPGWTLWQSLGYNPTGLVGEILQPPVLEKRNGNNAVALIIVDPQFLWNVAQAGGIINRADNAL